MKKIIQLQDLDCANCAAKMESAVGKVQGVNSVTVNFMSQKMILDLSDTDTEQILKDIVKACKKADPDCSLDI